MTKRASPEGDLQRSIIELAEVLQYRVYHVARVKGHLRSRTAPGFPDLCLAGRGRLLLPELKSDVGHLTDDQKAWQAEIEAVTGPPEHYVWRPRDWDEIAEILQRGPA